MGHTRLKHRPQDSLLESSRSPVHVIEFPSLLPPVAEKAALGTKKPIGNRCYVRTKRETFVAKSEKATINTLRCPPPYLSAPLAALRPEQSPHVRIEACPDYDPTSR